MTAAAAERGPQLPPDREPVPPPPDPLAIRACLTSRVAAEFDTEWDIVLDKAKQSKGLAPVHALLHKWRHVAYSEMKDPGCYFHLLATAARTLAIGEAPPRQRVGRRGQGPDPQAVGSVGVPRHHIRRGPGADHRVAG